jgi:hypothetical protein
MVTDVDTKLRVTTRAMDLLQEFQGEELNLLVDLLVTLRSESGRSTTGGAGNAVGSSTKNQGRKNLGAARVNKTSAVIVDGNTPPPTTLATEEEEKSRNLRPWAIKTQDEEKLPDLVRCVLSDFARARRAMNALQPRMDHKSIRERCKTLRKKLRRALKDLNKDPDEGHRLKVIMTFVNLLKSFRLLFSDAFTVKCELNVGEELLTQFLSIERLGSLVTELENGGLDKCKDTYFWQDSSGKLPGSSSPGIQAEISPNPFST